MKHSDTNHSENSLGIHLSNKKFSITDHQMSTNSSNSNAVLIGPMIPTSLNPNQSSILSSALNTPRSNSTILTKPLTASSTAINANLVSQLTYISPNNNTIKLVNLSKCQQLPNLNKDSSNMMTSNAINVQFVTPILNNASISTNESTGVSNSVSKVDNSCLNKNSIVLTTSSSNQSMSNNNSITCTRFILHSSHTPILPHGPVTIIPHHGDMSGSTILNNQLIKNTRFALTGTKQTPQAIRPITACSASSVTQSTTIAKQTISKISPAKPPNNVPYTINIPDNKNAITIPDLAPNRHGPPTKDQQRSTAKTTPNTPINYTGNNIRLALTSNVSNSKVNVNPSKVQLISPKTRKRSGSPVYSKSDVKSKDLLIGSKDENTENPSIYNSQSGAYSPARKRARKQHLKGDSNSKVQKVASSNCSTVVNNTKQIVNDKPLSAPISIAPVITKYTSITSQNRVDDHQPSTFVATANNNPQIIIPLKTPIHICSPKTASSVASIYAGHISANNCTVNSTSTSFSQIQIITQNSNCRPLQLSPVSTNLILSPSPGKLLTSFSPQKVIHIAPSKIVTGQVQSVKNEKLSLDPVVTNETVYDTLSSTVKEPLKIEASECKIELWDDSNAKYSLFPHKYHWNAKRSHFEKESDVKIKKPKPSNVRQTNSDSHNNKSLSFDVDDTRWRLYKARNQLLMLKSFDEENLRTFHRLKEKFDLKPQRNHHRDEPIFQKVCPDKHCFDPLPDLIDTQSVSEFTDPKSFGIADDVFSNHLNALTADFESIQSQNSSSEFSIPHRCSDSCSFYLSEVPTVSQPPHIVRIIDLIEGLIVKEKKIIEKESEINDQCMRLLESSSCPPLSHNRSHNKSNKVKMPNGRRF